MLLSSDIKIRNLVGICFKDVPLKEDKSVQTLFWILNVAYIIHAHQRLNYLEYAFNLKENLIFCCNDHLLLRLHKGTTKDDEG